MERTTTMVRAYLNQHPFTTDEQKRGPEGWSVQSTVNPNDHQVLLTRIRSRFSPTATHLIVTWYRPASF